MTARKIPSHPGREIITTRIFDAPRHIVWEMWSNAEHLKQWWGPNGFTNTFHEFDFKPGGHWHFLMHGPDGTSYKNEIVFVELNKPELLICDHISVPKFRITALFEEMGSKTKLTFHQLFESDAEYERVKPYAVEGSAQTIGRLADLIALSVKSNG